MLNDSLCIVVQWATLWLLLRVVSQTLETNMPRQTAQQSYQFDIKCYCDSSSAFDIKCYRVKAIAIYSGAIEHFEIKKRSVEGEELLTVCTH